LSIKKIGLIVFISLLTLAIIFGAINVSMYTNTRNIKLSVTHASESLGSILSIQLADGLGVFPQSWELTFNIWIQNDDDFRRQIEEVNYIISLDDSIISEGQFKAISVSETRSTKLPDITTTLSMEELVDSNPQLITSATNNDGKINFKISVDIKTSVLLFGIRIGSAVKSDDLWEQVQLVDSISVIGFDWLSGERHVDECYPGDDVRGQFRISRTGVTEAPLEAKISEISSDGSETVLALHQLEGELEPYYSEMFTSWSVPEEPSIDCVGFSIHLLYAGIEIWSTQVETPSLQLVRRYTLSEAIDQDFIVMSMVGTGYCAGDAVDLKVEVELEVSIDLEIESGTVLVNSGSGQNMIVGESQVLRMEPKIEVEVSVESYCLDMHKDNPSSSETFTVLLDSGEYTEDAIMLMTSLEDAPYEYKSVAGVQIALWAVTDNPSREEVDRIFTVTESYLEDAAWLLQNIGIDPSSKEIFS